jgi:signal transduction histidine kinase
VMLVDRDHRMTDLIVIHADPSQAELVRRLISRYPQDPKADVGIAGAIRHARPELVRDISDELLERIAPDPEQRHLVRTLGLRSYVVVPMVARERVFGAIALGSSESGRAFDEHDLEIALHLGRRAALALDNARLYEDAREAIRLREQVLAIVSHDLRSPLSAVQLATTALARKLEPVTDHAVLRYVGTISRSIDRMKHLIDDLLDVASIQTGRLAVEPCAADISVLLEDAREAHAAAAAQKHLALRCECAAEGVRVRADPERILQVLANLLGNAIKFCPEGETIVLHAEPRGAEVVVSVHDTGPGMSADDLTHLFEPYWSAPRHASKGIGLGLYISRCIVEAHGGRIWADSTLGVGSTVFFTLSVMHGAA